MQNKQIPTESTNSRRSGSMSRNLFPLRNNSIRGASMNHSAISGQLSKSNNSQTLHNIYVQKNMSKTLTVLPDVMQYYLGKGNNEGIIRRVMGYRSSWAQSDDSTSAFLNMKWQQDQKGYRYNRLVDSGMYRSVVNHFEYHENLSNKQFLFRNLEKYCAVTITLRRKIISTCGGSSHLLLYSTAGINAACKPSSCSLIITINTFLSL